RSTGPSRETDRGSSDDGHETADSAAVAGSSDIGCLDTIDEPLQGIELTVEGGIGAAGLLQFCAGTLIPPLFLDRGKEFLDQLLETARKIRHSPHPPLHPVQRRSERKRPRQTYRGRPHSSRPQGAAATPCSPPAPSPSARECAPGLRRRAP